MTETIAPTNCFHCGENCREDTIRFDDKPFCCSGCQTVYEILSGNELNQYYTLEKSPGISRQKSTKDQPFAFLDEASIADKLLDFREGSTTKVTFFIPVIHCSSCIWLLENLARLHRGILRSRVQFLKKEVCITFCTDEISFRELAELLDSLGYTPDINLASTQERNNAPLTRNTSLAVKAGVAGFCFGNAMLLSLPEYLDTKFALDTQYRHFFSYINLALALPVFFYAASGYFRSALKGLLHRNMNLDIPIALGILALFGRSAYEILTQTGPGYVDSLTGLVFFLLIGQWYQSKTYQALSYERDYASYFPVAVTKFIDNKEVTVPLHSLDVDDCILLRNQELIPADAILLSGKASVDYSFVTGESQPVTKEVNDLLYAGGRQMGSTIVIRIHKPVANSYLTQLWNQDIFHKDEPTSLTTLVNKISRYFTLAVLLISAVTALYWYYADSSLLITTVTSVLIVACPCALALSTPFAYGHSLRILGKQGLYLKNAQVVEKMARVDEIIFDKTGTITQAQSQQIRYIGQALNKHEQIMLSAVVRNSTHPLSKAIYDSMVTEAPTLLLESFYEETGKGIEATLSGHHWKVGSAPWVVGTPTQDSSATRVYIQIDYETKGYFEFAHQYRPGFRSLMQQLRPNHKLHLLSGDQDSERVNLIDAFDKLHFRQSPLDKLNYVKRLDKSGHFPMMIGDGLNDAGALKQSYVGVAVADNVYHFSPACDAILSSNQLTGMAAFLKFTKSSHRIVKTAFLLSFLYNVVGLSFAVSGLLTPLIAAILMPLSSVTVVGFITLAVYATAPKTTSASSPQNEIRQMSPAM